jgi:hypothetical protein
MSEPPSLEALARRYLDLWQDQATALAGDVELARQIGQWLSMMQAGMVHGFQSPNTPSAKPGTAGSTPAAPPSGGSEPRLDQLARRLAALEKRLGRLEAGAKGRSPKPGSRSRARKR